MNQSCANNSARDLVARAVRDMETRGFAASTRTMYASWIRRFLAATRRERATEIIEADVTEYIEGLIRSGYYKTATVVQAANAVAFLMRSQCQSDPDWLAEAIEVQRLVAPPIILTAQQAAQVLARLNGAFRLMAWLAYGAGLSLNEIVTLRVGAVDMGHRRVRIEGHGDESRTNPLPKLMMPCAKAHMDWIAAQHELDCRAGYGHVLMGAEPEDTPLSSQALADQFLFPTPRLHADEATGHTGRRHINVKGLQRAISQAGRDAGIDKPVNINVLRGTFAAEKLASGSDTDYVRRLMGHKTRTATLRYAQALTIETADPAGA